MFGTTSKAWGTGSIWGNGGLSANGGLSSNFASVEATRNNSRSRDASQHPASSPAEDVEGKSGSSSLVDGSMSLENWSSRNGARRQGSYASGANTFQPGQTNSFAPQHRAFSSSAASSQSLSGSSQHYSSLTRPTPSISLNNTTSSTMQRPTFGSSFQGSLGGAPPPVYTKFDRPAEPVRELDSALGNCDMSPVSPETFERRPTYDKYTADSFHGLRNLSQPPSRQSDFHPNGYQLERPRPNQASSASASRAQSFASQSPSGPNGFNRFDDSQIDPAMQFGQLSLTGNGRTPISYRPSISSNGVSPRSTSFAPSSSFGRTSVSSANTGPGRDDVEEIDRAAPQYLRRELFVPQQTSADKTGYSRSSLGNGFIPGSANLDVRNIQPFTPGALQSRAFDPPAGPRSTAEWQGYANGSMALNRRSLSILDPRAYLDPRVQQLLRSQWESSYTSPVYNPYALPNGIQIPPYLPVLPMQLNGVDSNVDPREVPSGDGVQSALMYEFKSNTKTKRYELKDIYDHIAEFSGDQHGSRFIQTKLETANSDEKDRVFREIEPNAIPLMTDVFGNYVIQKFFEHGDQTHKKILANKMRGQVLTLSLQMYGCRVVQKALDHVLVDQQAVLIGELENHVLKCVKDQNGNHVIQKAIERCPTSTIGFIINAFRGQIMSLSIHPYGCRVIQRCLERCDMPSKSMILDELMEPQGIPSMISDQYGNYVVQHVVLKDDGRGKARVLQIVLHGLEGFSKHKFASNVVEKCLEQADDGWRRQVVWKLCELSHRRVEGEGVLVGMIKDNFGNYVIQKLLDTLNQDDFKTFHELLQPAMQQAKKTGCGKQVQSIEKKMHRFPLRWNGDPNGYGYNGYQLSVPTPLYGSHFGSAANTPPPLTADTQSLQSSTIPSINGDAVEGADRSRKSSDQSNDSRYGR